MVGDRRLHGWSVLKISSSLGVYVQSVTMASFRSFAVGINRSGQSLVQHFVESLSGEFLQRASAPKPARVFKIWRLGF